MGQIIGVISIKGGVGKTTVAANLGYALTKLNQKTLLVDADFSSPSLSIHFGIIKSDNTLSHVLNNKIEIDDAIHEYGKNLDIIPSSVVGTKSNVLSLKEKLKSLKKQYDTILIDSSPTLNEDMLATIMASDKLITVTSADYPTLGATLNAIKVAKKKNTPIIGLILNRTRGKNYELSVEDIESASEVPILGVVNDEDIIPHSISKTTPAVSMNPSSNVSVEFMKIAACLTNQRYQDPRFFKNMFSIFSSPKKQEINREVYRTINFGGK